MKRQFSIQSLIFLTGGISIALTLFANGIGYTELILLVVVCSAILIPGLLRQFRFQFGIGNKATEPPKYSKA